eukprot:10469165-Lingulodinium_polyedra.AAC.1
MVRFVKDRCHKQRLAQIALANILIAAELRAAEVEGEAPFCTQFLAIGSGQGGIARRTDELNFFELHSMSGEA